MVSGKERRLQEGFSWAGRKGRDLAEQRPGPRPGLQLTALRTRASNTLQWTGRDASALEKGAQCAEILSHRLAPSALGDRRRSPGVRHSGRPRRTASSRV